MIKVYRKTVTIKAEQFDGSDEMVDKYDIEVVEGDYADDYSMPEAGPAQYFRCFMPSGYNEIYAGDWIATGANGEHWAIADDVFKQTYAELPMVPKAVADWIYKCKHDGTSISFAMDKEKFPEKVADYFRTYYTRDQWIEIQDTFARAWLDGYTVEEDK